MNVFHKGTIQSLKMNKTRTAVTIIGIILSAAMICAVTTFASSIQNYVLQTVIYSNGNWHGRGLGADYETHQKIKNTGDVEQATYLQQLGYAVAKGSENEYKPYIYLMGAGDNTDTVLPIHITLGHFPANANEILLPEHLHSNGGVKHSIGDTLVLELGQRMLDGYPLTQNEPTYVYKEDGEEVLNGETLAVRETRIYTVVGFYERMNWRIEPFSAPGYTALTVADKTPSSDYRYDVYFRMENPKEIYGFMETMNLSGDRNTDVLMYSGVSRFNSFSTMLYSLAAIVIGLIMFGSVSLIYNAFSISVSERTKQFGLLSSIGATKKQCRRMVLFEALVVSAIGIPLGVLAGVGGIGVTLMAIGNKFHSMGFALDMKLSVSPLSIAVAALVALITVLISAWIPSKRATRISVVEAVRQNRDVRAKGKQVKTPKLTYKLFGLPGVLAQKHYKRSRKKYRTTILSLFMSIVLFVSASAFTDYMMEAAVGGIAPEEYDFVFHSEADDLSRITQDELLEAFKSCDAVTDAVYEQSMHDIGNIPKDQATAEYIRQVEQDIDADSALDDSNIDVSTTIGFVNDDEFRSLLHNHQLNSTDYMNPEAPLAIAVDDSMVFDSDRGQFKNISIVKGNRVNVTIEWQKSFEGYENSGKYTDQNDQSIYQFKNPKTGAEMELPAEEAYTAHTLRAGKVIRQAPFYEKNTSRIQLTLLYPQSLKKEVLKEVDVDENSYLLYYLKSDNPEKSREQIKTVLLDNQMNRNNLHDYAETEEENRNIVLIIKVFSYGFIVLISLIAAANVFNTISTNISLRRREFAMLKSVGMTTKGFNQMMNFECILYGSRALLYGLPVSGGITYLIWLALSEGYKTSFRLPWKAIGMAVLSVFAVVFATMLYSMNKIKKDNPIDALKNENI